MSVGPLGGVAGSVAGSPLAQTQGSELERAAQDTAGQARQTDGQQQAESAAGIGEADGEDHETAERDADGRRLWERLPEAKQNPGPPAQPESRDATGQSGNLLDLSG
jgi:hypothetical protein